LSRNDLLAEPLRAQTRSVCNASERAQQKSQMLVFWETEQNYAEIKEKNMATEGPILQQY